ncbi:glutathione-regulated potassium-efflux system ancillary protein [Photobacterium sp. SKA34]|uniref:glutathione-regulated potassium-efflux system ancillary protein KefG n=1 Tax=Photobacterium sp. SKA34 TaxID=121723 RepID=UPI00006B8A47|nr:glutathione-regulated potassium-efflux system ancillary protein KefG [Photobacterium sp. SKA34]EAR54620.1 glutathione-regulated potassium-efflux system ancillary protein [Photobacterium sp. SKA34]
MTRQNLPSILIIFAHPDPDESVANRAMLQNIELLGHVTVHDLYATYPDFFIDVVAEHELIAGHDIIIFQHPLYMYSCPSLLKEWFDRVLSKGFAHGDGNETVGKYWRSVITTGGGAEAYSPDGYNRYGIDTILKPFEICADLCQMHWLPPLILHWARRVTMDELSQYARAYQSWLANPLIIEPRISLANKETNNDQ